IGEGRIARPAPVLVHSAACVERHFVLLKSGRQLPYDAVRPIDDEPLRPSTPLPQVPGPAKTSNCSTSGSVISSGVERPTPSIMILTVRPFANSDAGTTDMIRRPKAAMEVPFITTSY